MRVPVYYVFYLHLEHCLCNYPFPHSIPFNSCFSCFIWPCMWSILCLFLVRYKCPIRFGIRLHLFLVFPIIRYFVILTIEFHSIHIIAIYFDIPHWTIVAYTPKMPFTSIFTRKKHSNLFTLKLTMFRYDRHCSKLAKFNPPLGMDFELHWSSQIKWPNSLIPAPYPLLLFHLCSENGW